MSSRLDPILGTTPKNVFPHGTDPEEIYEELENARDAVRKAAEAHKFTLPHKRDFYDTSEGWDKALHLWKTRDNMLDDVYEALGEEMEAAANLIDQKEKK